jgi:NADPH2:quinone reductase
VYFAADHLGPASGGTYAEGIVCRRTELHRLPDRISYAQGAAIGVPYVTAYRALFQRAAARPGETVFVHGATGGVGVAAVELAHAHGLRVIASGGTSQGLEIVRRLGADVTVNHTASDYLTGVIDATDGRGVDVVIEMAAHLNLDKDLGVLARGGRVVIVGNRGRIEIDPRQAMARDAAILGLTLFNASGADVAAIHAALGAGLSLGVLNPVIARELPLAEAPRAHEAVLEPGAHGKIVLTP